MLPILHVVKFFGTVFSIAMCLAGLSTISKIKTNGRTPPFSIAPFLSTLGNGYLWAVYGILKEDLFPTALTNGVNSLLAVYYCQQFYIYTSTSSKNLVRRQLFWVIVCMLGCSSYAMLGMSGFIDRAAVADGLGFVATIVCVVMFASPLSTLRTVLATKSSESMNLPMVTAGSLCAGSWLAYGLLVQDSWIMIPNVLGFSLSLIQLGLILLYRGGGTSMGKIGRNNGILPE